MYVEGAKWDFDEIRLSFYSLTFASPPIAD